MERLAETVIFPAGPGDAAALGHVHVTSWRETYQGLLPAEFLERMNPRAHARRWRQQLTLARPGEVVMAAEGPGGLVGYCTGALHTSPTGEITGEVVTLYLLRAAQGIGLGRRLMVSTARVLDEWDADSLVIWVLSGNRRARRFYDHMGGVVAAERAVRGWGGGLRETAYRWTDIGLLTRAP